MRRTRTVISILLLTLLFSGCVSSQKPFVTPVILADKSAEALRERAVDLQYHRQRQVMKIWHRLVKENAELCQQNLHGSLEIGLGFAGLYFPPLRSVYKDRWQVGERPTIIYLPEDGVAARGGVQLGDQITAVNQQPVPKEDISTWVEEILLPAIRNQERVSLSLIHQDGTPLTLTQAPTSVCRFPVEIHDDDGIYAATVEGRLAYATQGIIRFVRDEDQLAWALGHELAHLIMRHNQPNAEREYSADYLGTYLTARAGYDPASIIDFWQRLATETPATIEMTDHMQHPSVTIRIEQIQAAIKEINDKKANQQKLLPNI